MYRPQRHRAPGGIVIGPLGPHRLQWIRSHPLVGLRGTRLWTVILFALVLSACGGTNSATETPAPPEVNAQPAVVASPTAAPSSQSPGPSAEPVQPSPTEAPPAPTPVPPIVPEPTAAPQVLSTGSAVKSLYLASAKIYGEARVEVRGTEQIRGRETLQTPTSPLGIAWYRDYGAPGVRASNSVFAAHVDYVGYGKVVFGYLTSAQVGDALYIAMADGQQYAYTVKSVAIVPLTSLDMEEVMFPALDSSTERATLISCGGTFVPYPGGGGEYDSRVILVAERYVS